MRANAFRYCAGVYAAPLGWPFALNPEKKLLKLFISGSGLM